MQINEMYLKKISFTGMSESNTILIDDNEHVVSINAMNSILIKRFDSFDCEDMELNHIAELLVKNLDNLLEKKDKHENIAHELTFNVLFQLHKYDLKE